MQEIIFQLHRKRNVALSTSVAHFQICLHGLFDGCVAAHMVVVMVFNRRVELTVFVALENFHMRQITKKAMRQNRVLTYASHGLIQLKVGHLDHIQLEF